MGGETWRIEPLELRLVNSEAEATVELGDVGGCRDLWQIVCEAIARDVDVLELLRVLVLIFPPPVVVSRPGRLTRADVCDRVVRAVAGTAPTWRPRWGGRVRIEGVL